MLTATEQCVSWGSLISMLVGMEVMIAICPVILVTSSVWSRGSPEWILVADMNTAMSRTPVPQSHGKVFP